MDAQTVLDMLFKDNTVDLPVAQKKVRIKKATLRTLKPIIDLLQQVIADLELTVDNLPSLDLKDPSTILKLISKYYDQVMDLAAEHSEVERDELVDMDMEDSVLLIQCVIALNQDFFMTKVLPTLQLFKPAAKEKAEAKAAS